MKKLYNYIFQVLHTINIISQDNKKHHRCDTKQTQTENECKYLTDKYTNFHNVMEKKN